MPLKKSMKLCKAEVDAYRKDQVTSREIEMTMAAVGPIHVEVGID
jgi:hypothetical protein